MKTQQEVWNYMREREFTFTGQAMIGAYCIALKVCRGFPLKGIVESKDDCMHIKEFDAFCEWFEKDN